MDLVPCSLSASLGWPWLAATSTAPLVLDSFEGNRWGEGAALLMCLHGTLQCRLLCCSVPVDQISWGGDRRVCGHFGSHFKAEVWTGCLGNEGVGGNVRGQCCECVADEPPVILPKPMRLEGAEAWLPSHQGQEGYFELPASHEYCDGRVQDDDECSGFNLTCPTGSLSVPFNQACWAAWGGGRMAFSRLVGWRVPQSTPTPMRVGAARATLIHGRQPPSAFCRICESTVPWAKNVNLEP